MKNPQRRKVCPIFPTSPTWSDSIREYLWCHTQIVTRWPSSNRMRMSRLTIFLCAMGLTGQLRSITASSRLCIRTQCLFHRELSLLHSLKSGKVRRRKLILSRYTWTKCLLGLSGRHMTQLLLLTCNQISNESWRMIRFATARTQNVKTLTKEL